MFLVVFYKISTTEKMKNLLFILGLFSLSKNFIVAESIQHVECTSPHVEDVLEVIDVRVSPCPSPGDGQTVPCIMPRGTVGNISVEFTPKEPLTKLDVSLSYVSILGDLPFPGLESNLCNSLDDESEKCPLQPDTEYTWITSVKLSRFYQPGIYPLKLKFTDANRRSKVFLCQTFSIKLT